MIILVRFGVRNMLLSSSEAFAIFFFALKFLEHGSDFCLEGKGSLETAPLVGVGATPELTGAALQCRSQSEGVAEGAVL